MRETAAAPDSEFHRPRATGLAWRHLARAQMAWFGAAGLAGVPWQRSRGPETGRRSDADRSNLAIQTPIHNLQFRSDMVIQGFFIDSNDFWLDFWY
jgi:hypothetical protein